MDLKQLQYFVRVAELGGYTKAATVLSVAQPTLSKQVRQLEVELRQNLFVRNGRGVNLTEEGRLLLAHARGILEQVERARQEIIGVKGSPIGKVVVGMPPGAGKALVVQLMAQFRSRFPRASLEIIEGKSWFIHEWLLTGRIDIGVIYDPRPSSLIESIALGEEEVFLISSAAGSKLPASRPVRLRELGKYPLILPSYPHPMRTAIVTAAANAGVKLDIAFEIEGAGLILALVDEGHGYTVFPKNIVTTSTLASRLQVNPIVAPRITRTLTIAVSRQRQATRLSVETVALLRHHLESGLELLKRAAPRRRVRDASIRRARHGA